MMGDVNSENGVMNIDNGAVLTSDPVTNTDVMNKLSQLLVCIDNLTSKVDIIDKRTQKTDERLEKFESIITASPAPHHGLPIRRRQYKGSLPKHA